MRKSERRRRFDRRVVLAGAALLGAGAAVALTERRAAAAEAPAMLPVPAQAPAKEGLAEVAGTRLYYWDTGGSGAPVVLLHPATGSALMWVYQQPAFAAAGFRVIGYSRRGYYGSDPGTKDNPGVAAEDLDALITYLGIQRFHAVSSAAGGGVALDYALSHPDKLLSLAVTSSNGAGLTSRETAARAATLTPEGFERMPPDFREIGPSYRAANPDGVRQWLALEHKALVGELLRQKFAHTAAANGLGTIRIPTLLMTGDADLYAPPALMRMMADQIPGSEFVVVPDVGHALYWERPDVFNSTVLAFIAKHAR
jgi:pimeloyl-ACP methyl ester carboxylesterase